MAAAFGTQPAVAAFWMAYRFANLFRRLFGEGGLHIAFVPHLRPYVKKILSKERCFSTTLLRESPEYYFF